MNPENERQARINKMWEERNMGAARDQPPLPTQRAFVVQLHVESKIAEGQFKGRVEHIVSGQSTHFSTIKALKAFMRHVLTEERSEEPEA